MSLTAEQLKNWQEAVAIFKQLTEHPDDKRLEALSELSLREAVRQHVKAMLQASQTESTLDSDISVWVLPNELPDLSGQRLGAWRLSHEIGRGGMAVVYRAEREDAPFAQSAAVKLLPRGAAGHEHFQREQQVLAQLEHPNIARLLDGGVDQDGTPWLAMELIVGERIDDYCRQLSVRRTVQCLLQVAHAVAHAHRHLIIHRDLKPGNILVDEDGRARLLDFGIARLLSDGDHTPATRIMTPEYAAPEQHRGEAISTATDVYGLGAVLHKLLTDEAPQRRDGSRSSALHDRDIDRDLKAIVSKALREEPDQRYRSAESLANDLNRWLESRPVEAAIGNRRYHLRKWLSRHRFAVIAGSIAVASLLAGVASTWWQSRQVQEQARMVATQNDFLTDLLASPQSVARGRQVQVVEILDEAVLTLEQRFAEPSAARASLLSTLARTFKQLDQFESALPLAQRAIDDLETLGLDTDERYLRALLFQAGAMIAATQHMEAKSVLVVAITLADTVLPVDDGLHGLLAIREWLTDRHINQTPDPDQLKSILLLADTLNWKPADRGTFECGAIQGLRTIGQMTAVIDRAESSLEWARSTLGERHSNVLCITMELVTALGRTGQLERAVTVTEQNIAIASDWLGPNDRVVYQLRHSRANLIQEQGRLDEALIQFSDLIAERDSFIGLDDNDRLLADQGIAVTLIELGRYADAEQPMRELIAQLTLQNGVTHPLVLINQTNLAELLILDDRPEQAIDLSRTVHDLIEERFGTPHPFTLVAQAKIGGALAGLGEYAQAVELLEPLDAPMSDAFSQDDVNVMLTRLWYAEALIGAGQLDHSPDWLLAARDWMHAAKGSEHPLSRKADALLQPFNAEASKAPLQSN